MGDRLRLHELKCDPSQFESIWQGHKLYEVRKFDRDYREGDDLRLMEFDRETGVLTGREIDARVTVITQPDQYGLPPDVGVLGIVIMYRQTPSTEQR